MSYYDWERVGTLLLCHKSFLLWSLALDWGQVGLVLYSSGVFICSSFFCASIFSSLINWIHFIFKILKLEVPKMMKFFLTSLFWGLSLVCSSSGPCSVGIQERTIVGIALFPASYGADPCKCSDLTSLLIWILVGYGRIEGNFFGKQIFFCSFYDVFN